MPGEDPMTLPTPEEVAEKIFELCLPSFCETGKLYDFRAGKLLEFIAARLNISPVSGGVCGRRKDWPWRAASA